MTRLLRSVDLTRLSPTSQAVRILIGESIPDGYPLSQLAGELGRPASWVSERLASLRNELLLQSGLFFPLSEHEYESLRASIERHGVRQPVLVGEHIALIDGRHRLLISEELGLPDCPALFLQGLTAEEERELTIALNAARRQLSRQQKKTLVEAELMRDAARSDRLIASVCGVSHTFASETRAELVAAQEAAAASGDGVEEVAAADSHGVEEARAFGEQMLTHAVIPPPAPAPPLVDLDPPTRTDRRGATQTTRSQTTTLEKTPRRIAYVTCSHGQVHGLYRDNYGEGWRLEAEID